MTATVKTARNEIYARFNTEWLADGLTAAIPVLWGNVKGDPPVGVDSDGFGLPWARVTVQHAVGGQRTLGGDAKSLFGRDGFVTVQLFGPVGLGFDDNSLMDDMIEVALRAFDAQVTPSNIWFRNGTPTEVGVSEAWFQTNVVVEFTYDQLR